ncbi:hypothetical protein [Bacillus toyonensis]|uniref:Uncharacterized protein n=1 Tax=Bacillus toyonensis TaxID=155322 RepID=A0A2A8H988_9BACI|nr:hypothetical protein [Bacillus toyonensis]PEP95260.1 hypothetical protein CN585_26015 [Bacillus toyonensis]
MTSSINGKFGTSITITNENTETRTNNIPAKSLGYQQKYANQIIGIYSKQYRYYIKPGANLQKALDKLSQDYSKNVGTPSTVSLKEFTYTTIDRAIVTTTDKFVK